MLLCLALPELSVNVCGTLNNGLGSFGLKKRTCSKKKWCTTGALKILSHIVSHHLQVHPLSLSNARDNKNVQPELKKKWDKNLDYVHSGCAIKFVVIHRTPVHVWNGCGFMAIFGRSHHCLLFLRTFNFRNLAVRRSINWIPRASLWHSTTLGRSITRNWGRPRKLKSEIDIRLI